MKMNTEISRGDTIYCKSLLWPYLYGIYVDQHTVIYFDGVVKFSSLERFANGKTIHIDDGIYSRANAVETAYSYIFNKNYIDPLSFIECLYVNASKIFVDHCRT